MAGQRAPEEGLGPLVAALKVESPLLQRVKRAACALGDWLRCHDTHRPAPGFLEDIIGLGPGLTPSGDDFVGGAMIALHAVGEPGIAARIADWVLPLNPCLTGKISAAHLACAAGGQGAGAVHRTLEALGRSDAAALSRALTGIDRIGHSSGWDALAGAVVILNWYREQHD